jgi:hypothetical protein
VNNVHEDHQGHGQYMLAHKEGWLSALVGLTLLYCPCSIRAQKCAKQIAVLAMGVTFASADRDGIICLWDEQRECLTIEKCGWDFKPLSPHTLHYHRFAPQSSHTSHHSPNTPPPQQSLQSYQACEAPLLCVVRRSHHRYMQWRVFKEQEAYTRPSKIRLWRPTLGLKASSVAPARVARDL